MSALLITLITLITIAEMVILGVCFALAFGGDWSPLAAFVGCQFGAFAIMIINGLDGIDKDMEGY